MKKDQLADYIRKIEKRANVTRMLLGWGFLFIVVFSNLKDHVSIIELFLGIAVLYLLVSHKTNDLKQKAIIRYMTDTIGDQT